MKKIFITILVVALTFTITGTVMAGKPKPPKTLCIELSPSGQVLFLGIKKGNKTVVNGEKVDMYTVQGFFMSFLPVTGTGYMDGGSFNFSIHVFTGQSIDGLGVWSVEQEGGVITLGVTDADGFEQVQESLIPCAQ